MTVTQVVGGLGSWELRLIDETPKAEILDRIDYFGHLVIVPGQVDVESTGQALLKAARYVGVLRAKGKGNTRQLAGSGMLFWLGDEDDKGHVIEIEVNLVAKTLLQAVTAVKPPSVTIGTVYPQTDPLARYTGKHVFQSPRKALDAIASAFGAEIRVNGDGTLDVGTQAQLYATAPRQDGQATPLVTRAAGSDIDLLGLPGEPDVDESSYDYSTDVLIVGQTTGTGDEPSEQFAVGRKTAASIPYVDLLGNPVKFTRIISESGETVGTVDQRATLQLNRFNRLTRSLALEAGEYEAVGDFVVGDQAFVYDPETGIQDFGRELIHGGERIWPDVVRVSGMTWPVTRGHTVAFRTGTGVWLDLTPFVTWETSGTDLVVGDLPKSLTRPSDPLQDRVDAARANQPDTTVPNPPAISLTTYSVLDGRGNNAARIRVAITPPTTNTDGSVPVGVAYYVVRWTTPLSSTNWNYTYVPTTVIDVEAMLDLDYKVEAAASDGFNQSAWSTQQTIRSSVDTTPPPAPADPVLTSRLGQLRIEYIGVAADGQPMPKDTKQIDFHVGDNAGFTPTVSTRVTSVNPFARSVHPYDLPFGITKYVKLQAIDHAGNVSATTAAVAGATEQLHDGDIAELDVGKLVSGSIYADIVNAGRFTTALFGQRTELNSVGVQAFNALEQLTVSIDGINNLFRGAIETGTPGERRILIDSALDILGSGYGGGKLLFIAPNGVESSVTSFSTGSGEGISMELPMGSGIAFASWNSVQVNDTPGIYLVSRNVDLVAGRGGTAGVGVILFETTNNTNLLTAGARISRYQMDASNHTWWPAVGPGGSRGYMTFATPTSGADTLHSPQLNFVNSQNFGAGIRYFAQSGGANPLIEVVTPDGSAYHPIGASAFPVSSDLSLKDNVQPVFGVLAELLGSDLQVVDFDWKEPGDDAPAARTKATPGGEPEIVKESRRGKRPRARGLVAQQVPKSMQMQLSHGLIGYDTAAGVAVALGSIKELAGLVLPALEEIRGELAANGGKR